MSCNTQRPIGAALEALSAVFLDPAQSDNDRQAAQAAFHAGMAKLINHDPEEMPLAVIGQGTSQTTIGGAR